MAFSTALGVRWSASAISEEVAAHASDTLSATESNNVIVEELAALSGQLETLAQELKEQ